MNENVDIENLDLSFTREESRAIATAAKAAGVSVSDYIRHAAVEAAENRVVSYDYVFQAVNPELARSWISERGGDPASFSDFEIEDVIWQARRTYWKVYDQATFDLVCDTAEEFLEERRDGAR